MSDSRTAAVALARRGLRVFRTSSETLRPIKAGWTETASSDPDAVEREFSDALGDSVTDNIAVATGDGIMAFDFDVKKGAEGALSMAELVAEGLPETFTVRTASGGWHRYYCVGVEHEVRNRVKWRPGVDIRGHHGYVSAPGSIKPDGRGYVIERDLPIADLPAQFVEMLARPRGDLKRELEAVDARFEDDWAIAAAIRVLQASTAVDGEKHNELIRMANDCFDLGVTPETFVDLAQEHWPLAHTWTQSWEGEIGSLVRGRLKDGKQWGRLWRPSVYRVFDAVAWPEGTKPKDDIGVVSLAELAGVEPAPRQWLVADLIPDRTVTLLMGDGGVGKSLLTLQLCAAGVLGREWLGLSVKRGPVLYAGAEDELDEIHRRMLDIGRAERFELADLASFHVLPLAGLDAVMSAPDGAGSVKPTRLWRAFEAQVERLRPSIIVLDTLADVYAGEENTRAQVRQFIGMVRGLAIRFGLAALILGHPSLSGMSSGSGSSGSTGWNNSVRSRLYLKRPDDEDERKRDSNVRLLQTMKQNYGPGVGDERRLRWEAGRFVLVPERIAVETDIDPLFMEIVDEYEAANRNLSDKRSPSYAPAVMAAHPRGKAFTVTEWRSSMERLFEAGIIIISKNKRGSSRIVRNLQTVKQTESNATNTLAEPLTNTHTHTLT